MLQEIKDFLLSKREESTVVTDPFISESEKDEIKKVAADTGYAVSFEETPVLKGHGGDIVIRLSREL